MFGNEEKAQPDHSLQSILSAIEGVGAVQVYIYEESTAKESRILSSYFETSKSESDIGILIVAEGAKDERIKKMVKDAVKNVMNVPAHRIVIVPMKEEE